MLRRKESTWRWPTENMDAHPPIAAPSSSTKGGRFAAFCLWFRSLISRNPSVRSEIPSEDDAFAAVLLADVAKQISTSLGMEASALSRELVAWKERGVRSELLRSILRVECTVEKATPSRVRLSLQVAQLEEEKCIRKTLSRDASWDELPPEIRRDFNLSGQRVLSYVLCDSEKTQTNQT